MNATRIVIDETGRQHTVQVIRATVHPCCWLGEDDQEGRLEYQGKVYTYAVKEKVLVGNYRRFIGWQLFATCGSETHTFLLDAQNEVRP